MRDWLLFLRVRAILVVGIKSSIRCANEYFSEAVRLVAFDAWDWVKMEEESKARSQ